MSQTYQNHLQAITKVNHVQRESYRPSNQYNVAKRGYQQNRPIINLKRLNEFIPYRHFEMEGLHLLQEMVQQCDYFCKIDLKDANFCIPLHKIS